MNSYRFKYHISVWLLLILVVMFSGVGLGWNIFNLIEYSIYGTGRIIYYSIIILLILFVFTLSISMLIYGKYVIKDEKIYACFGFIRSKSEIKNIVQFTHFKKSNKLVAYFANGKYTVIVIFPDKYDDFIQQVRKYNRQIIYESKSDGNGTIEEK